MKSWQKCMNRKTRSSNKNNFRYFSKWKTSKLRKQRQITKKECNKISSNLSKSKPEKEYVNKFTKEHTIWWMKMKNSKSKMSRIIPKLSGAKKYAPKSPITWRTILSTDFPKNKTSILLKSTEIGTFTNSGCTKTKCNK